MRSTQLLVLLISFFVGVVVAMLYETYQKSDYPPKENSFSNESEV